MLRPLFGYFILDFHPNPWSAMITLLAFLLLPPHRRQALQVVLYPASRDAGQVTSDRSGVRTPIVTSKYLAPIF